MTVPFGLSRILPRPVRRGPDDREAAAVFRRFAETVERALVPPPRRGRVRRSGTAPSVRALG